MEMTAAPESLALVSTIVDLVHALKLKVVAEGIDTPEQARLLLGQDKYMSFCRFDDIL